MEETRVQMLWIHKGMESEAWEGVHWAPVPRVALLVPQSLKHRDIHI